MVGGGRSEGVVLVRGGESPPEAGAVEGGDRDKHY